MSKVKTSDDFEFWKMVFDEECCTIEQLKEATEYNLITKEEFKIISNKDFN